AHGPSGRRLRCDGLSTPANARIHRRQRATSRFPGPADLFRVSLNPDASSAGTDPEYLLHANTFRISVEWRRESDRPAYVARQNHDKKELISHELNEFNELNSLNSFNSWLISSPAQRQLAAASDRGRSAPRASHLPQ